jgi:transposase
MSSPVADTLDPQVLLSQIAQLTATNQHLLVLVEKLQHQISQLTRRQFGVSSEHVAQLGLFAVEDVPLAANPAPALSTHVPAHERRVPVRRTLPEDLPRQVITLELDEAKRACPCCQRLRQEIGEEVSEKLDIEPARMTVLQYRRKKYACRACEAHVQVAPMPAQVIEQGLASPGLLAHVAVAKFADHTPLARLEKSFARQGIDLPRSTLTDWMLAIGQACEPIVQRMGEHLKALDYLGSDDTTLPYQDPNRRGKTRTARLWVWRGELGEKVLLLYQFSVDRSGRHPAQFVKGWKGYLQADAYSGYDAIFAQGHIIEVGCMAHARRHFFEIAKAAKTPGFAHGIIDLVKALYGIEREAKDKGYSPEQIKALRQERAPPIFQEIKQRLEAHWPKLPPKGPLAQAIGYALRQWQALTRYLEDGRLHIDNNRVEGAIRPVAQGRNNYLFVASERGGNAAAVLYSLVQSAIANGINPYAYLRDVLTRLPTTKDKDIDSLLPHLWCPAD